MYLLKGLNNQPLSCVCFRVRFQENIQFQYSEPLYHLLRCAWQFQASRCDRITACVRVCVRVWGRHTTGAISLGVGLGHVCRIPEHRSPKKWLLGSLLSRRPACGPRLRWRDLVRDSGRRKTRDSWYPMAQVRPQWRQFYTAQCNEKPPKDIGCEVCGRSFRRQADCNRHKCSAKRARPVRLQAGICSRCGRLFKSAGGIAVHKCSIGQAASNLFLSTSESASVVVPRQSGLSCCSGHCSRCGQCCNSKRGFFQLHQCAEANSRSTASNRSSFQFACGICSRCFRRPGGVII